MLYWPPESMVYVGMRVCVCVGVQSRCGVCAYVTVRWGCVLLSFSNYSYCSPNAPHSYASLKLFLIILYALEGCEFLATV